MPIAAIYCRSSKDRAEVGLDAQRNELKAFAKTHGLTLGAEFSDMEISGSLDETSRDGLRQMLAALSDPARKWTEILALDTSRIARDPMLALYVTRECEKQGVTIRYAKMPVDGTSAFGETMLSVVRAFDRLHARLSAEKGRGGLAANIAKGFRAGGAAPFGYKLNHTETGALRGGIAVRKSTLEVDTPAASKVTAFLKLRADGIARAEAAKRAKLQKTPASLIAIERNALTYAGYTVWNMRRKIKPTREDPRKTMKWRPRSEWVISEKPTHPALITRAEAERILAAVDAANPKTKKPRVREPDTFVLSGMLFTPEGVQWHGDSHDNAYRAGTKGRRVSAPFIEGIVFAQAAMDLTDSKFLRRAIAEARRMAQAIEADPIALDADIKRTEKRLSNLVELAADSGDKAILTKIRELEAALGSLREQRADWAERRALKDRLMGLTEAQMAKLSKFINPGYGSRAQIRNLLVAVIERIELAPDSRKLTIKYRLPVPTGVKVASPRGFEPRLPP